MSTAASGNTGRSREPEDRHTAVDQTRVDDRHGDDRRVDDRHGEDRHADRSRSTSTAERDDLRTRTELELSKSKNRRLTDIGLLLLRLVPLILILHGINQLRNFSGFTQMVGQTQLGASAPQVFAGLVVAAHIVLPILIAVGALTRISALLNTVALASIWVFAHVALSGLLDAQTGGLNGEATILFALASLPLVFTGAGRFSIDHIAGRKKAQERAERRAIRRV